MFFFTRPRGGPGPGPRAMLAVCLVVAVVAVVGGAMRVGGHASSWGPF